MGTSLSMCLNNYKKNKLVLLQEIICFKSVLVGHFEPKLETPNIAPDGRLTIQNDTCNISRRKTKTAAEKIIKSCYVTAKKLNHVFDIFIYWGRKYIYIVNI